MCVLGPGVGGCLRRCEQRKGERGGTWGNRIADGKEILR